jgi:hypothetical protein
MGGRGGAAGVAGGGGGAPAPECQSAADCKLINDCCNCMAVPSGAPVPACSLVCVQSQCAAKQLPTGSVACIAGRCVAGFKCDASQVTCKIATPVCAAGEVPTVNEAGTCYTGSCAPETECTTVTGCASCTGTGEACASYETQLGVQHHCLAIPPECGGGATCECFGASACVGAYRACMPYSGLRGVYCSCPNC